MIPDLAFIQRTYDKFNTLCFEGALPPIDKGEAVFVFQKTLIVSPSFRRSLDTVKTYGMIQVVFSGFRRQY